MGTLDETPAPTLSQEEMLEAALPLSRNSPPPVRKPRRGILFLWLAGAAGLLWIVHFLTPWREAARGHIVSTNSLKRIANGLLLYAQDWDGKPMPPAVQLSDGSWQTWPNTLQGYCDREFYQSPVNPLPATGLHHPTLGYAIPAAYALNRRFWNTFGKGAFPLDNLDMPERTVLFVEAGPMWRDPLRRPKSGERADTALLDYGDTTDRIHGLCPYPSPHQGKMAVVAADGHAERITIDHYTRDNGPHDMLYGRIGGAFYNWNGGYPTGETDRPPRE